MTSHQHRARYPCRRRERCGRRRAHRRRAGAWRLAHHRIDLRTPAALDAIERIASEVPDIMVGAGTIVDTNQPKQAAAAARSSWCRRAAPPACGRPCATRITASARRGHRLRGADAARGQLHRDEVLPGRSRGRRSVPARHPLPVPAARFCPTGGITPTNVADYLKSPNVGCVGGSWLTPVDAVERRDWTRSPTSPVPPARSSA